MKNLKFLIGLALVTIFVAACSSTPKPSTPTVYPPITDAPCTTPAK